ncbi:RES family NAD+ phosphorylase [Paenibacillus polysaccharolyticus]|uniref:RES family NAD+ phosphorylase n=1 Tax=Paenibacillus polysaccharolyticus TaxID=582692 RepID=UPI00203FE3D0|nr:RES family NAD+ phosphorylase [Paenibacillus polysaccharolyticus]MCM3132232.1 RES family NAD+ phosphorylase [Paenibacillus polysaccharolyticus]
MPNELSDLHERTVCSCCAEDIFKFFEKVWRQIKLYERFVQNRIALVSREVRCEICNYQVLENEKYHRINVEDKFLIPIADMLSEDIGGCEHCHGKEIEDMLNENRIELQDEYIPYDPGGSYYKAGEYISDYGVPDSISPLFLSLLKCPCGYGRGQAVSSSNSKMSFSKYCDLYTKQEVESTYTFDIQEFSDFAEQYGEEISLKDLEAFKEILRTNPMLAYHHQTGRAIYEVLKQHFHHGNIHILSTGQMDLFRGRTRAVDSIKAYTFEELWTAPVGKSSHGRYNFIGVPVLYLTNSKEAIPYEINPAHDQLIDIATFKILRRELRLFNLGEFDPKFQGFFNESNAETDTRVKSAYLLPNYIGACCSHIGYDGIVYSGVHHVAGLEPYTNYALFDMDAELDLIPTSQTVSTFKPMIHITLQHCEQKELKDTTDNLSHV